MLCCRPNCCFCVFVDHGMSYLRRWWKIRSETAASALECSSEDDCPENLDHNQCDVGDGDEDVVAEGNSTLHEADELGELGYREYVSTDPEESIDCAKEGEVTFQENACFLGYNKLMWKKPNWWIAWYFEGWRFRCTEGF